MVVPTLYSNLYTGPAAMSFHAAEKEAKSQQDKFTSLHTSLPRDASTGKIDVGVKFHSFLSATDV